ncbi:MAG: hypothetical protein PHV34_24340 [Verrucomicrobiae bacterium]|nr:hypothetical protein [Verrucomicrobiae bacterium]
MVDAETKKRIRERWQVSEVTKIKEGMKMVPPFETPHLPVCPQGQPLEWLGFDKVDQQHWFGVTHRWPLCLRCWEAATCPKEFAHAPSEHETLLGQIPMCAQTSRRLLQQLRPWIEAPQSFEKNQLGLSQMFFNSLRLTWMMSLFADSITILRALAKTSQPPTFAPMYELMPKQGVFNFGGENQFWTIHENSKKCGFEPEESF